MTLRKKLLRLFSLIAVLLLTLPAVLPCSAAGTQEKRTVKVGFYSMPGYQNIGDDGTLGGYAYDYMQELSQYTMWDIEYVTGYDWSGCLQMLASGEIDMLCGVLKTEEREKVLDYAELFSGIGYSCLSVLNTRNDIAYEDFESFDGMCVGVAKGSARNDTFLDYCRDNGFSVTLKVYDSEYMFNAAVRSGEVDAIMTTSNLKLENVRIVAKFDPQPQYIATSKGNTELLRELNTALTRLKTDVPNFDDELYSRYYGTGTDTAVVFSKAELAYIAQHPTAIVMYDPAWAPIELTGENGEAHGISIDILEKVSEICGIKFKYTTESSFSNALQSFLAGGAEIFSAITYDYAWAAQNSMYLTQPYLEMPFVTIYREELGTNRRVALPTGYYITHYMEKNGDAGSIVYYDTVEECIEAVRTGAADYTFVNSYEADYYLAIPKYRTMKFRTLQSVTQRISVAVSKDADPLLYSIICKSVQSIPERTISSAIRTHTEHTGSDGFFDMLYTNPVQFFVIVFICIVMIITIFVVFFFYLTNKKKNIRLQQALAAKSTFLSNMSHDMRTPMNGILGLLELTLDSGQVTGEARDNLLGIQDSGKYLLCLINDSLDMSRMDSGKLTLNYRATDPSSMIRNLESYIRPLAEKAGVTLNIIVKGTKLPPVMTDPLRLEQIFVNIVSNSVKFTPAGGRIDLTIDCYKRENGKAYAAITVLDTGIGMSREFLPKIFEPFEQENTTVSQSGTGLGMSIVKKLVEMMGGSIEVRSEKGAGTEVTVRLAFENIPDAGKGSAEKAEPVNGNDALLAGRRILLAEDNPLNAKIAVKLLERKNMTADLAVNGAQALKMFTGSAPGYYDAILMDIRMPEMDGLEAASAIRASRRPDSAAVPIIAMTANAFAEDMEKSAAAGMNAHLSKPVEPELLYKTLGDLICVNNTKEAKDEKN